MNNFQNMELKELIPRLFVEAQFSFIENKMYNYLVSYLCVLKCIPKKKE